MASNRACITLILLALAPALYAQAGSSRIDGRFVQRLAWSEDENTLRYEVIIEREADGEYSSHHHEFTDISLVEVSLPPGKYRYRIIPYNFFNRPGPGTQWVYIEVRPLLRPEVDTVSQDVLHLDDSEEYVLIISGRNIEPDADIHLRSSEGVSIVPYMRSVSDDGVDVSLYFTRDQLSPGVYEIYIRNLSGLETSGGRITVDYPEVKIAQEPPEEREAAPDFTRLNTIGVSLGSTFAAPLLIATVHGTFSPLRYAFLEAGIDLGMKSMNADIDYFSLYPFARIGGFLPLSLPAGRQAKIGWYAGAGAGYMLARYTFPEGDTSVNEIAEKVKFHITNTKKSLTKERNDSKTNNYGALQRNRKRAGALFNGQFARANHTWDVRTYAGTLNRPKA